MPLKKTDSDENVFNLEMPKVGIIRGVVPKDIEVIGEKIVSMRIRAKPYANTYSVEQLRALRKIAEEYGSGKLHLSPRHNFEIPEIREKEITNALTEQYKANIWCGGAGTSVRNVFTCAEWCSLKILDIGELGKNISIAHGDEPMPNKLTISLAACPNGCSRPESSDIGVVAVTKLKIIPENCKAPGCTECLKKCRVSAITLKNGPVLDKEKCVNCGLCAEVCPDGAIKITDRKFRVTLGGKEGRETLFGLLYTDYADEVEVLNIVDNALKNYQKLVIMKNRKKYERLGETLNRVGIKTFMSPTPAKTDNP